MIKIVFFIESLNAGGKERRLVELIKGIVKIKDVIPELVLIKNEIFYKEIISLNVKIHVIERKFIKKDPRLFYLFYKICKKTKPRVIHVWGSMPAIYSIPAKLFLGIPMINSEIADSPSKIKFSLLSHKISFPFSDLILSNSQAGLDAYNAPKSKNKIIYNGFDFKRIKYLQDIQHVKKNFDITTKLVVGMVATFSDKKDYITYIDTAIKVLDQRRDVTFLCIGAGDFMPVKKYYASLIEKKKIQNNILFLGRQENVESIMNVCDIGVLSTNIKNHGEGISNAILEFMALGKPVIATEHGGNLELIKNKVNGFLVKPNSIIDLTKRIIYLLDNIKLANKMGITGKHRVRKYFKYSDMFTEFISSYYQVLNK